jgi:hypothetical protein
MAAAGIVVVLDFDKTIIDTDSDNWVVDELGFTELFNELHTTIAWNSMMVYVLQPFYKYLVFAWLKCMCFSLTERHYQLIAILLMRALLFPYITG